MKGARQLSNEDRILWHTVARTATPLKGKSLPSVSQADLGIPEAKEDNPLISVPAFAAPASAPVKPRIDPQRIDAPTRQKIAKGRIQIDGKVDLHGLTQVEAHSLLLGFLHQAYARDRRHVLVVTGKGASFGSEGVLKRAVPAWFATPPFRALVGGYHEAARQHGGDGALYVRLRRRAP